MDKPEGCQHSLDSTAKASSHTRADTGKHTQRRDPLRRRPLGRWGRKDTLTCQAARQPWGQHPRGHTSHVTDADTQHHRPATGIHTACTPVIHGTDTAESHSRPLTISPPSSGTRHTALSHACASIHDGLHPEPASGPLTGIHLSTLPAGRHSCTNTAHLVPAWVYKQSEAPGTWACWLGGPLSHGLSGARQRG